MKFISISVTAVHLPHGVVLYYAAVDSEGDAWWLDSDQAEQEWRRLPPHPGRGATSGSAP
jgi:hypothetical protein